jgi:hypothetical protein
LELMFKYDNIYKNKREHIMPIKESIEHAESKLLLSNTEREMGVIETYSIQLKPDLLPGAWLDLPQGPISAVKIIDNGTPKFMFHNEMDNYYRASIVEIDDVIEGAKLISVDMPETHAQALADDKIRSRSIANDLAIAKAAEHARHCLVGLNALSSHHGFEPVEKYTLRYDLSSLPLARAYNELPVVDRQSFSVFDPKLFSPDVMKGLRQLSYQAEYKHDVSIVQHEDHVDVKITDLKGKVLSKASLPFCLGEEEYHSHDIEELENEIPRDFAFIPEIIKTKAHDEEDFQPVCIEKGRPVSLEHSRFAKVYDSLQFMTFIPEQYIGVVNGVYSEKGKDQKFEATVRYNLAQSGIAKEVADLLKPKRDLGLDSGMSISA